MKTLAPCLVFSSLLKNHPSTVSSRFSSPSSIYIPCICLYGTFRYTSKDRFSQFRVDCVIGNVGSSAQKARGSPATQSSKFNMAAPLSKNCSLHCLSGIIFVMLKKNRTDSIVRCVMRLRANNASSRRSTNTAVLGVSLTKTQFIKCRITSSFLSNWIH